MTTTAGSGPPHRPPVSSQELARARTAIADLLSRSQAFRALESETRHRLVRDTTRIAAVLAQSTVALPERDATRSEAVAAERLLTALDFPSFVSDLVAGVFDAIVDASIEQMEAYGRLVADVCASIDDFRDNRFGNSLS